MNFGMVILNQSIKTMQNHVTWMQAALLFILKLFLIWRFFEDIADDVKRCLDTAKYSEDDKRPLPRGMNKKVIGSMINQLGAKIMIEFVTLYQKHILT